MINKILTRQHRGLQLAILGCIFFLTAACQEDLQFETAKLDEATMVKVLKDVHLAEAWLATMQNYPQAKRDSIAHAQYLTIFELHKITAEDYEQSMQAYMGNPKAMKELYDKVLEQLNKEEVKATLPNQKQPTTTPQKDSVLPRQQQPTIAPNQLGRKRKQK